MVGREDHRARFHRPWFFLLEEGGETCCLFVRKEDGELSKAGEESHENYVGHPHVLKQWWASVTVTRRKTGV